VSRLSVRVSVSLAVFVLFLNCLTEGAFAQQQTPVFTPGNLIVSVGGCATQGGTCTNVPFSGNASMINGPLGGYSDDQGSPWTLFQYSVNGASSATYVNSLQLPQAASGANFPISNDYGSLSEGTLQLSGDGRYLTIMGYGLDAPTFNSNYLNYCPGSTDAANACVPSNLNPAMAQTGSLTGQTYPGNTPVPRVAALVDPYGNVNTSTALYNIYNQNDARSAYTLNGSTIYVSGQGCKTYSTDLLCDNTATLYDNTMGIYLSPVGGINETPTPITGPDNGPTGCLQSGSTIPCTSSEDTRMVTIYNGALYVSIDSKPGSSSGGYNRGMIGTLGNPPATSLYSCASNGGTCPTGDGPYGPSIMPGLGNSGGTGKLTMTSATGNGLNTSANNTNINLAPQNFFFASPSVLYVADTGSPKNSSNGPDLACMQANGTTFTGSVTSGSKTLSAPAGTFTAASVGAYIYGTGITFGTTISTYNSSSSVTMSAKATASGANESILLSTSSKTIGDGGLQKWVNSAADGSGTWSLEYTLYNGLNLILNSDCNPSAPIGPGGDGATGLYGVTGVVNPTTGVATLYVTSYPNNDLINSYLYGITDTLTTTSNPGTAFTELAAAPSDSVFRGVSMAPSLPNGSETITSTPSGLTFTAGGSSCGAAAGTYITPTTLAMTGTCRLSTSATQTGGNNPTNPATTTYNFASWQDGSTNAASDTIAAPSTTGVYNIAFQTIPAVTFPTASAITYGQPLSASTLTGGSAAVSINGTAVPGTFAFTAPSTVPSTGTSQQSVTFTPMDTADYASVTGTVSVTVDQATTTISVLPTVGPLTYGQQLSAASLNGGSAVSGSATVSGTFAFTTPTTVPPLGTSSQSITFTPADPTDYSTATGTVMVTVSQAGAMISITNTTQTYSGSPEGVTVTTSPSGLSYTASYTGTGSTSYGPTSTPPTNPGTYSVLVTITDTNYSGQQSGTLTINQLDPTAALALMSGAPMTTPYGTTVYLELSTATAPQCPTGTAQLFVDNTASGTPVTLSSPCSQPVQFSIATLTAGQHSIYVAYSGDTYFESENTNTLTYTVTPNTTTVTLATSSSNVNVDQAVTFTATITPAVSGAAPTGTVTFSDGGNQIGTGTTLTTTSPYTSTFTTSSLAAGSHSITASFTDTDGNFTGNSSQVNTEVVNLIVPVISWTPSPTEFPYGTPLGSGQLDASGATDGNGNPVSGSFTYNFASGTVLPVGTANLIATFTPTDPNTYASNSESVTLTIDPDAPAVTLSTSSLSFPSTVAGSTSTLPVTITNSGNATLNVTAIGNSGTNPSAFSHTSNCGGNPIAPGASCTAQVSFTPGAAGSFSATLDITDNAADSPQAVTLTGTATAGPTASLSTTALSFPSTQVGATHTLPVTVTNTGSGNLVFTSITNTGANPSLFSHTSNCGNGVSIASGSSCTIQVIFTPTAAGTFSATLNVTDNATGSPQTVALGATATAGPAVTLSPTSLSFPSTQVGSASTLPVTVMNSGSANLSVSLISNTGVNASLFTHTSTCGNGTTIAPGSSCTIQVIFTPTAAGTFSATLNVTDNATGSPQSVALSATATAGPAVTLSPTSLSFPSTQVGSTSTLPVTVMNSGSANLSVSLISNTGANASLFTHTSTCGNGATIAPGSSCTIQVIFTPTAAGTFSATLNVTDNATGSPQTVALSATATAGPVVTLSTTSLAFPAGITVGSTSTLSYTITNSGSGTLNVSSITNTGTNPSNFTHTSNCGGNPLTANQSCTVKVTFAPSAAGAFSATMNITDDATGSPQSVALSGTGN
jgi:hypothetical protein